MKLFLSLIIIMFSLIMMFIYHPLSMVLMILIQTLFTCLISGMIISTYWFSYILFITFLGGLLVMFIYISSIASNEMFKFSLNMIYFIIIFTMIIQFLINNNMNNLNWLNFTNNNNDMTNFYNLFMFFNNENKINLSKLYDNQTYLMMMMMIIYLFITLIAIVKITDIFYGPIRSSFN
uniref:NADH-ubiquinone oxidoreductase chain 6 n=1 Tax=Chilo auricilius TaxID=236789 RepID=A0A075DNP6_CHIAR|nr:NADH dehydrogenase subunit 6 [Chilo auricilius]